MRDSHLSDEGLARRKAVFATTHWSVVLAAKETDSTESLGALEKLCLAYWYPLYAFVAPGESKLLRTL
jgi:hypothetical protein